MASSVATAPSSHFSDIIDLALLSQDPTIMRGAPLDTAAMAGKSEPTIYDLLALVAPKLD